MVKTPLNELFFLLNDYFSRTYSLGSLLLALYSAVPVWIWDHRCLEFAVPPVFVITGLLSLRFLNASGTGIVPEQEPWCFLFPKLLQPVVS